MSNVKITEETIIQINKKLEEGKSIEQIAVEYDFKKSTFTKALNNLGYYYNRTEHQYINQSSININTNINTTDIDLLTALQFICNTSTRFKVDKNVQDDFVKLCQTKYSYISVSKLATLALQEFINNHCK